MLFLRKAQTVGLEFRHQVLCGAQRADLRLVEVGGLTEPVGDAV